MKDETYVFISDVKDKKVTARSARNQRTHTGKGGRVRLPSDNLSKNELMKMSGDCKSYKLNSPMKWDEFKSMPDDIQRTYIKLLREKFDVPDCELYKMFGTNKDTLSRYLKVLGLRVPRKNVYRDWKKDEWFGWVNGVDLIPAPVPEEPIEAPIIEEAPVHFYTEEEHETIFGEAKGYMEDDLPIEEPDPVHIDPIYEKYMAIEHENDALKVRLDELLKANEELKAVRLKDKEHIAWLEVRVGELGQERLMLEKQMDVVRLIFGGRTNV
jgi:hypothetical protein